MYMVVNIRERENVFKALLNENPDCDLAKLPKEDCMNVLRFMEENCMELDPECCDNDFKWVNINDVMNEFDFEDIIELADTLGITLGIEGSFDKSEEQLIKEIYAHFDKYGIKEVAPFVEDFYYHVFIIDEENRRFFCICDLRI